MCVVFFDVVVAVPATFRLTSGLVRVHRNLWGWTAQNTCDRVVDGAQVVLRAFCVIRNYNGICQSHRDDKRCARECSPRCHFLRPSEVTTHTE